MYDPSLSRPWRKHLTIVAAAILMSFAGAAAAKASGPTWSETAGWPTDTFETEFGVRYWANWGATSKDLYDTTGSTQYSRLTYSDLSGHAGEIYGRIIDNRYFVKGFAGLGSLGGGNLQDEDFPPAISPYSSTQSDQHGGSIGYFTLDGGRYFWENQNARIGAFVGYNYFNEQVDAYGCTQTASNPGVCVPSIASSTAVISQTNKWNSVRLGVNGEVNVGKWSLRGEVAALPYVSLSGADSHWLRICSSPGCFTGALPEDGTGWGYQAQASLDYQVSPTFSIGIGARYWHMETDGHTHFEDHIVGATGLAQVVNWQTDIFGLTAHAALRF